MCVMASRRYVAVVRLGGFVGLEVVCVCVCEGRVFGQVLYLRGAAVLGVAYILLSCCGLRDIDVVFS